MKWIKARMDRRIPPTLPTVDQVLFSPENAATKTEKDLSMRWNTGVRHFDCEACGNTTNLLRNAKELTWKMESPPPRNFEVADTGCFQNLPAHTPPEQWTNEAVHANLCEGAAGPDGMTSEFLHTQEDDSFDWLIELLDKADSGHLPEFWREVRGVMIPKGFESDPSDRRPLTIMTATYSLWARRHAMAISSWLDSWCPPNAVGARRGFSAAEVAQEVSATVNDARSGRTGARFILSVDQSKYFDRLSLDLLQEFGEQAGIESVKMIIQNYKRMSRQISVEGSDVCGIPQGCPVSCVFAFVAAFMWVFETRAHNLQLYAYLDDWIGIGHEWSALSHMMTMTMTMTHSEKSNICQMKAWPYRQECRGHDPTKKNLLCC